MTNLLRALARWLRRPHVPIHSEQAATHFVVTIPELIEREWTINLLTPREMEVAKLIVQGKRNSDIARELMISINTVESHVKNIYTKLEIHSRLELARTLREWGIGDGHG